MSDAMRPTDAGQGDDVLRPTDAGQGDDVLRPNDAGQGDDVLRPNDLTCDDVRELAGGFVLGALDPVEDAAVRAHLVSCPELHEEIAELGSVLPVLQASVAQVEPSAGLKSRLMAAAAADLARAATTPSSRERATPITEFPPVARRDAARVRRSAVRTWGLRIAAVLVIGVLGAWNVLLQGQLDSSRTYETNVAAVLDLAREAGSATAVLTPTDGSGPAGVAAVGADGTMAVAMRDLAPTAGTEVYEVWMIGGDGVPVALGGFTVGSSGIGYFQGAGVPASPGIVLALTKEPAPGATAPTSDPVSLGTTLES